MLQYQNYPETLLQKILCQ